MAESVAALVERIQSRSVAGRKFYHRSIEQLHKTVSMLTNFVWTKQLRDGEHMWSIPVDQERDFDCILTDAIDELQELREAASRLAEGTRGDQCPHCGLYGSHRSNCEFEKFQSSSPSSAPAATPKPKRHKKGCAAIDDHHVCDGTTFKPCDCGAMSEASPRVSAATPAHCEGCDFDDRSNDPKPPHTCGVSPAEPRKHPTSRDCEIAEELIRVLQAERPAQTCATCKHDTYYAECKANWRRPIVGVYWKRDNGCTLHEPAPPGPVAQEKK